VNSVKRVATTGERFSYGSIPFDVAHLVVDGRGGVPLAPASANYGDFRIAVTDFESVRQPIRLHFTVAIDKHHPLQIGMQIQQCTESSIAGSRSCERAAHIQFDTVGADGAGEGDAVVFGSGIHIHQRQTLQRIEATLQAFTFVATYSDNS